MHVMRTYGKHGGEQQLSQYLGAQPYGSIKEMFTFLYRDDECAELFRMRVSKLPFINLLPWAVRSGTAWRELLVLLPILPWLVVRFVWILLRNRPSVCVVHGFQAAILVWPVAILLRRVRWIYVHRITKSSIGSHRLFRIIYRPFDVVAGNSKAVKDSLKPLVEDARLLALENGLDWRSFDARAELLLTPVPEIRGRVLVVVGRLLPHKGQTFLIEVLECLDPNLGHIDLWILGDGIEMDSLQSRVAESSVADRIHLLGHREDVPAVLRLADIFVNASAWEGMSNAVLEGMAAGLPAVVADAPGVSECHVDGVTGFIVKRQVADFVIALSRLLGDAELCEHIGNAARRHVKEYYSMEASRKRYLVLFERLTGVNICVES